MDHVLKSKIDFLIKIAKKKKITVGMVIPALNESRTIGKIIKTFIKLKELGLLFNIYVVDDGSIDNTIKESEKFGAVVFNRNKNGNKNFRKFKGKGFAIWESLNFSDEKILVFYDGDVKNPKLEQLVDLVSPLIIKNNLVLAKADFERNLYIQGKFIKGHGGRLTEILLKPLIGYLFPDLVYFKQPTGGFYAVRSDCLRNIDILGEAGADPSVLINLYKKFGLKSLTEVYIDEIIHDNKELKNLTKASYKHIQSLFYLKNGVDNFNEYSTLYYNESGVKKKKNIKSDLIILKHKNDK
jgi:glucosyl-3-phosphoglycerate synthase